MSEATKICIIGHSVWLLFTHSSFWFFILYQSGLSSSLWDYWNIAWEIFSVHVSLQDEHTTCAPCRKDNPLVHDPAWHPKTTLDTLVQSSLIKACAFFCYWQVHLQTTIHQTSTPSLQASNKLSKSDLWWQSFTETEWSVSIACIFYPSPFISLWMNSAP